ncbi:hypothetical protein LXA43DRAFT_860774, partial [Ganoderma leucocontextum]
MLLWIKGSLSPRELREQILSDEQFEADLLQWLETCHTGNFSQETEIQLADRMEESYIVHHSDGTADEWKRFKANIRDPATSLPIVPPPIDSPAFQQWYTSYLVDTDEVVFASNRHDRAHGKGCWRGDPGYCRARFPRECFPETIVDRETGAIRFKKTEAWINTYNRVLSHILRSNTDVTCLLSGTQVRAIVVYITDYITKGPLSTYNFFEVVRAV